jgi:hypothetical protein
MDNLTTQDKRAITDFFYTDFLGDLVMRIGPSEFEDDEAEDRFTLDAIHYLKYLLDEEAKRFTKSIEGND